MGAIQAPLTIGKEWRFEYTGKDLQNGIVRKDTGLSKVVGQESITTSAGTFDAFKVDRRVKEYNVADPSRLFDLEMLMWFSPQVNHWVRRNYVVKGEGRVLSSTSEELINYLQKPSATPAPISGGHDLQRNFQIAAPETMDF